MKALSFRAKVTTEHPMHKLYEAANDIVNRTVKAHNEAKVPVPDSFSLSIWIDGEPVMRITIEVGSKTTAEYAIFKAQKESK